MDNKENPDHIEIIKRQIEEALQEIENVKSRTSKIRNAEELEKFEEDIAKKTDKLAGLLTAKAIQESLDSEEMKQKSNELIKSMPHQMRSQGLRDVKITPARGGSISVKAAYYTKKKKRRRKKKKSSSTPSTKVTTPVSRAWLRNCWKNAGCRSVT